MKLWHVQKKAYAKAFKGVKHLQNQMCKISSSIKPAVGSIKNHNNMKNYETMGGGGNIVTALG